MSVNFSFFYHLSHSHLVRPFLMISSVSILCCTQLCPGLQEQPFNFSSGGSMIECRQTKSKREIAKIWPFSIQFCLSVSDPAGQFASLSHDHKVQSAESQAWPKPFASNAQKNCTRTQRRFNSLIFSTHLDFSAPTFTHVEGYPSRLMKGSIPHNICLH